MTATTTEPIVQKIGRKYTLPAQPVQMWNEQSERIPDEPSWPDRLTFCRWVWAAKLSGGEARKRDILEHVDFRGIRYALNNFWTQMSSEDLEQIASAGWRDQRRPLAEQLFFPSTVYARGGATKAQVLADLEASFHLLPDAAQAPLRGILQAAVTNEDALGFYPSDLAIDRDFVRDLALCEKGAHLSGFAYICDTSSTMLLTADQNWQANLRGALHSHNHQPYWFWWDGFTQAMRQIPLGDGKDRALERMVNGALAFQHPITQSIKLGRCEACEDVHHARPPHEVECVCACHQSGKVWVGENYCVSRWPVLSAAA